MPAKERHASLDEAQSGLRPLSFPNSPPYRRKPRKSTAPEIGPFDLPDPYRYLHPICALGGRPTGSLEEKRAFALIREQLRELGMTDLEEQTFACNTSMFRAHILVFLFTLGLGALAFILPPYGFFVATCGCFLAFYLYGDLLEVRPNPLTASLANGTSQNLIAKISPQGEVKSRVVLTSHVDTALCSPIFGEKMIRSLKTNIAVDRFLLVALGFLYAAAGIFGSLTPYYVALLLSLYLLGSIFVLLYSEMFSPISPGANDNASGIAALLALAEHYTRKPLARTEIWFAFLGAKETGAFGAKAMAQTYAEELRHSFVVNVDSIGIGNPRYVTQEGFHHEFRSAPELVQALEELSFDRPDLNLTPLSQIGQGQFTDTTDLLRRGVRAITVTATDATGYIPYWHTLQDTYEALDEVSYYRGLEVVENLLRVLDREIVSFRTYPVSTTPAKKQKPRFEIVTREDLKERNLREVLWPNFDAQAQSVFQTTAFFETHAKTAAYPNGFIVLAERPDEPVFMVPYFVYHELVEDGAPKEVWYRAFHLLRKWLPTLALPIFPGFKTIFVGTPFSHPANQIFARPGVEVDDLLGRYEHLLKFYQKALRRLQIRHVAPIVSHVSFERKNTYDMIFRNLGFDPSPSWPEMYLDYRKIQLRLRDRMKEQNDQTRLRLVQIERKLEELKVQESILLHDLEEEPEIKRNVGKMHLLLEEEDKRILLAADAQNQIDKLFENLETGKYIANLEQKRDLLKTQQEEIYAGYAKLPPSLREKIGRLATCEAEIKDAEKGRDRLHTQTKESQAKIRNLLQKSLENKFDQSLLPAAIEERITFFMQQRDELESLEDLPATWRDITYADARRRLDDLGAAVAKEAQEAEEIERLTARVLEMQGQFDAQAKDLGEHHGPALVESLKKLFQAEMKEREIQDLEARIADEREFFKRCHQEGSHRTAGGSPERDRLLKAMEGAFAHRETTMRNLGITGGWNSLPGSVKQYFQELAFVRVELRRLDHQWREAERQKRQIDFDLSQKEFGLFGEMDFSVTFDEYVESLSGNERNAMRRNLKRIRATAKDYPIEILTDPESILELSREIYRAYEVQYEGNRVKWVKITRDFLRNMAYLPGVQVFVCWHIPDLHTRNFAGFILNMDGQFNFRMGIAPEYRHVAGGENGDQDDNHLIYFRLTLRNIEENLASGNPGMWIAQTTYEAKRRLGFEVYPLVNYRRSTRLLGLHVFSNYMYRQVMEPIQEPETLARY